MFQRESTSAGTVEHWIHSFFSLKACTLRARLGWNRPYLKPIIVNLIKVISIFFSGSAKKVRAYKKNKCIIPKSKWHLFFQRESTSVGAAVLPSKSEKSASMPEDPQCRRGLVRSIKYDWYIRYDWLIEWLIDWRIVLPLHVNPCE